MLFFNFLFAFACIINIFPFCFIVTGGPRKGERRAYKLNILRENLSKCEYRLCTSSYSSSCLLLSVAFSSAIEMYLLFQFAAALWFFNVFFSFSHCMIRWAVLAMAKGWQKRYLRILFFKASPRQLQKFIVKWLFTFVPYSNFLCFFSKQMIDFGPGEATQKKKPRVIFIRSLFIFIAIDNFCWK